MTDEEQALHIIKSTFAKCRDLERQLRDAINEVAVSCNRIAELERANRLETALREEAQVRIAELEEAAECGLYAIEHPDSDQQFAANALRTALQEDSDGE